MLPEDFVSLPMEDAIHEGEVMAATEEGPSMAVGAGVDAGEDAGEHTVDVGESAEGV